MKKLTEIWDWLNGKKTVISMTALIVLKGITTFFPVLLPVTVVGYLTDIFLLTGGIGAGHSVIKTIKKE